jgi:hypothetical protein
MRVAGKLAARGGKDKVADAKASDSSQSTAFTGIAEVGTNLAEVGLSVYRAEPGAAREGTGGA